MVTMEASNLKLLFEEIKLMKKIMEKNFFVTNEFFNIIKCFFGKIKTEQFCGAGLGSVFIMERKLLCV